MKFGHSFSLKRYRASCACETRAEAKSRPFLQGPALLLGSAVWAKVLLRPAQDFTAGATVGTLPRVVVQDDVIPERKRRQPRANPEPRYVQNILRFRVCVCRAVSRIPK
jgi:hypothetical protein